jgi:nucleoside-diphosphate-sugar epimerase
MLKNKRLLMTGLTGQLAGSIAQILAPHNEVYGLARYSKPGSKEAVEALGITPIVCDYTSGDFEGVRDDYDYVFHAAADVFPADIETGLKQNAEGAGLLLNHLKKAKAWIYVSTSGVYWDKPGSWDVYYETDRCGGSTRINTRFAYGTSKFAGEAVARTLSRIHNVPLTIARMNWSYGTVSFGGAPVRIIDRVAKGEPIPIRPEWEMVGCPIHEEDMADHLDAFFDGASVGGTVTNWAGDEAISVENYAPWLADLLGTTVTWSEMTDIIAYPRNLSPEKRLSLTGPCKIKWQDGFKRIVEQRYPGRMAAAAAVKAKLKEVE